ncbi:hypothetical protein COLO4_15014 [Corchorus olitorius]|uniref:CASP-like protein n=1 Tax=Corchorus olitorius TaxID=93759 RepID=A0A1R3JPX4_9ROSI|nr:hypothetical protein COLO4_15014 [Corchorus olitorius]
MFALLLASLVVLVTATATLQVDLITQLTVHFDDVYAYRYVVASIIIGLVISYVLATGSAAGFGATKDLKALADARGFDFDDYFDKAYASASLLLLAFLCSATLSVFSSYALPKVVTN